MIRPYVEKQIALIAPFLSGSSSLLDFGCGDLSLAKGLKTVLPGVRITGVDVVDSGVRAKGIDFRVYDGKRLPYANNTFDATVVYHVFHHCTQPKASLADVMRVTKKIILIVEPVYRNSLDIFFMKILDRVGNGWRGVAIPMPFTFQREETWARWAHGYGWTVPTVKNAGVLPSWLPFGVTKLFVLHQKMF
jgi:SAM-dependent methyltransferase